MIFILFISLRLKFTIERTILLKLNLVDFVYCVHSCHCSERNQVLKLMRFWAGIVRPCITKRTILMENCVVKICEQVREEFPLDMTGQPSPTGTSPPSPYPAFLESSTPEGFHSPGGADGMSFTTNPLYPNALPPESSML